MRSNSLWVTLAALALQCITLLPASTAAEHQRPNIVFIISEDNGPQLGCYGDAYANTPNIDALAAEGLRYNLCWSNAPVCAPARTTLFSGLFPPSTGAQHMRSLVSLPDDFQFFPYYLQEAGYLTANARKTDFNAESTKEPFDIRQKNNAQRPWKKAKPGQPFFAAFNIQTSHESQIRVRPHTLVHDPADAPIPAYHPDTPEVRHDWAQYYDKITEMDREVGAILDQLEEDGHAEDTIVFYFGDHGSGMPRSKRWLYNSGLRVPLIVRIPEQFQSLRPEDFKAGGASDRLVSFVDFGPTALSLASVEIPEHFQGRAFLGGQAAEPNEYLFAFRDRMDERTDMVRAITDGKFIYVRNFMPHRIYGQHLGYMFETPTTRVWKDLYDAGKLNDVQSVFWGPKPAEELYAVQSDPEQTHNLIDSAEHASTAERLRTEFQRREAAIRDVGFLPEAMLHERCEEHDVSPYELGHDDSLYDFATIYHQADIATRRDASTNPTLITGLESDDAAIRYWSLTGLLVRGEEGFNAAGEGIIQKHLDDESSSVRVVAAELIGRYGSEPAAAKALDQLLYDANYQNTSEYTAAAALLVVDELREVREELIDARADRITAVALPTGKDSNKRASDYPKRLKTRLVNELGLSN